MPEDSHDRKLIIEFFKRKGMQARPFSKTSDMPNPDFEIYIDARLSAYCELKSIMPYELLPSKLPSGQIIQVELNDSAAFNNIQNKIHEAAKQLRSINPNHDLPNIVFLVNHNPYRNVEDLKEVIGVQSFNALDIPCPLYPKYRNRLLRNEDLSVLDYIIYLEFHEKEEKEGGGETIALDDYAKDFLKYVGKDEKWAKEVISTKHSISNIAYYFLLNESRFPDLLKEKISSRYCEILTKVSRK
jgi:hypothetical protein